MKLPRYHLETIEDYYSYYVLIIGMSEDVFWDFPLSSVRTMAQNKIAYDNWIAYQRQQINERR